MAPYKADGIVVYTLNDSELTSLDISGIFQGHFAKTIQKFKDAKPRKTQ